MDTNAAGTAEDAAAVPIAPLRGENTGDCRHSDNDASLPLLLL